MKVRRRKAKAAALPHFEPAIRRNWGYWEGVAARKANRVPEWANKAYVAPWAAPHFDEAYKAGFLVGWEGEVPNWHPCPFEGK